MIGTAHVVECLMLLILRRQGRIVKEWGVLGVSCRRQFKAWTSLNLPDVVNFVSLILCLVAFCL